METNFTPVSSIGKEADSIVEVPTKNEVSVVVIVFAATFGFVCFRKADVADFADEHSQPSFATGERREVKFKYSDETSSSPLLLFTATDIFMNLRLQRNKK